VNLFYNISPHPSTAASAVFLSVFVENVCILYLFDGYMSLFVERFFGFLYCKSMRIMLNYRCRNEAAAAAEKQTGQNPVCNKGIDFLCQERSIWTI
jgi:hypothetical protein